MNTINSFIEHPNHRVPDEVESTLRKYREQELEELSRQQNLAKLGRPTKEERKAITEIYASAGQAGRLDVERMQKLRNIDKQKSDRVLEAIKTHSDSARRGEYVPRPPSDWDVLDPRRNDFWWARTEWSVTSSFRADLRSDGLYFFGGASEIEGDLLIESFKAEAVFELQANRIPPSSTGRWLSYPHIELFGGLFGSTGGGVVGDTWSKCWMHLKQQLFQNTFGPTGSGELERGSKEENVTLIYEVEESRQVRVPMPGYRDMPPVIFGSINTANSLWARLEIRFDIQVEEGFLWLDPSIMLRTFQWPLIPGV